MPTSRTLLNKVHVSQIFNVDVDETELDFFDTNLRYDSKLFIDPFLIKNSVIDEERILYERFTKFFKIALEKSIESIGNLHKSKNLLKFLSFREPKEICLGYTETSNEGSGLGGQFALGIYTLFIKGIAAKLMNNEEFYLNKLINPELFAIFADKVDQDGISDLTANLIMDYLIKYTQNQSKKWNIPINKALPVSEMFDFENNEWTGGRNVYLPENPFKPGQPFILVPKRFLRASVNMNQEAKKEVIGILESDTNLSIKFSRLIEKPLKDITIDEIRSAMTEDKVLEGFIGYLEQKKQSPYNFITDPLWFYAFKRLEKFFENIHFPSQPQSCEELVNLTKFFFDVVKKEYEIKGLWKDTWVEKNGDKSEPCLEIVWGRIIRAMGNAFFVNYPDITFISEVETGNGPMDFSVIYNKCKIAIEVKKLHNTAMTGEVSKLPAYIHGLVRQLPAYIIAHGADFGFYITGQHYKDTFKIKGKTFRNDSQRIKELESLVPEVKQQIQSQLEKFQELFYINIDLSKKVSSSKL